VLLRKAFHKVTLSEMLNRVNAFRRHWARYIPRPHSTEAWTDVEHDHRVPAGFGSPVPGLG
jgi:hypothetical protein